MATQHLGLLQEREETELHKTRLLNVEEKPFKRITGRLLVKRGGAPVLSRAAAAMALFTLQTYAPSGGAGHRTGFRGGGPLTTLALPGPPPGEPPTLWHLLWANVGPGRPPARRPGRVGRRESPL